MTPQEVRNCIFHGPFNDLLIWLNQDADWRDIMGTPGPDKRMRDVELIARFFALADGHKKYTKPMKDFISQFMREHQQSEDNVGFTTMFSETVDAVLQALGVKPFHIKRGLNAAVFDSVMVAFASSEGPVPHDIRNRYQILVRDAQYVAATTAGTTDETTVALRIRRAQKILFS